MENPRTKWWFIAGNIIYFYGPFSMAMLNNQMVQNVTKCVSMLTAVRFLENYFLDECKERQNTTSSYKFWCPGPCLGRSWAIPDIFRVAFLFFDSFQNLLMKWFSHRWIYLALMVQRHPLRSGISSFMGFPLDSSQRSCVAVVYLCLPDLRIRKASHRMCGSLWYSWCFCCCLEDL